MSNVERLLGDIREFNQNNEITEESSEADRLITMIDEKKHTKEEFFDAEKSVMDFMESDASEEDKQKVRGYTESLAMICNAIREGRLDI